MDDRYYTLMDSPVGELLLRADDTGLRAIRFQGERPRRGKPVGIYAKKPFAEATRQLKAYFRGNLEEFDLELSPQGTEFQLETWSALQSIPYGHTISYAELARRIGRPRAVRAVGSANGSNPLPIVIPCHRVIGSNGKLTGYGGGLGIKERLLRLEGALLI